MSLALQITLNQVPAGIIKCIGKEIIKFILRFKDDSYPLGNKLWDDNFAKYITTEMWCISLKKITLFKKTKVKDGYSTNFATCNDW